MSRKTMIVCFVTPREVFNGPGLKTTENITSIITHIPESVSSNSCNPVRLIYASRLNSETLNPISKCNGDLRMITGY